MVLFLEIIVFMIISFIAQALKKNNLMPIQ